MNIRRNSQFFLIGLVLSLIIAVFLSPFASPDPDGLDRVAEDLQFSEKEDPNALGGQLPFARIFDGYALKGVPEGVATPLAGFLGTLATFGIAWGIGKLIIPKSQNQD
ncbi:putative cobalt transport protein [Microcystis aeruginosa NIES-3804]|uniref:Putative cobalt transport protein n=1 Tax=Microcystis aeruginosa NIES-3804 TaxID=2517783 RepID=A0A6H9GRP8_MICAE|nr:PDGLE domain-containing protein [Microcystis aeruginosa]GCL50290.1 putative cobalt transport protein [Microcystis aeruginosa NIES-3804]